MPPSSTLLPYLPLFSSSSTHSQDLSCYLYTDKCQMYLSCFYIHAIPSHFITNGHLKHNMCKTKLISLLASKLPMLCTSVNDILIHLAVQNRKVGVTFDSFFSLILHPTNHKSCQFFLFEISQTCPLYLCCH